MPERIDYVYAHCISGYHDVIAAITIITPETDAERASLTMALRTARFIRDILIDEWARGMEIPAPNSEKQRAAVVKVVRQWLTDNLAEFMAIIDGEPSEVR